MTIANEVRVLVPKQILERAQKFAQNGLYGKALELLERNKMEFEIYDTFMRLRLPEVKKREYHFKKRDVTRQTSVEPGQQGQRLAGDS